MQVALQQQQQQPSDRGVFLPSRPTESRRAPPSQDRPFACPIPTCGGRFHRKFTLHEHMKTHTGEQPHECPVAGCGKRFSTSGNLARHRKLHSVRKLNCPTPHCSREFTSREKLMRHLKVHLAGTPHTCNIEGCGKTFSTAGNLTRHRRTRHNAPPTNRVNGMEPPRQPPMLKSFPFPEQQQRQFPMQAVPGRMMQYPVVPGAMLVKGPVWSPASTHDAVSAAVAAARPDYNRGISDQDVRDLLDCLFVENPAVAPVNNMGGIIRSERFLRGAYHQL
ncbi:hypothetical protein PF005_g25268 [Phytophthora fragariae]|uniref:C2H2-type domain-containing protein n=1 Tax=Phytophthora fragariae TaxID=53985 RepID=A0A6A3I4A4_9STRA|nr:hypothetical protein PF003_g2131 [Phytophthora fragariae]KAE8923804.1 hypothetical protein PF009_g25953 [Phytophthora fragariae]KAE8975785.1 hypothetical protein PF011_g24330 [Phytophthora fragariae]KAE9073360.1 hypothetical protein PF010_g25103 [Phytophthora fragariae]KAE9075378.1 hypothetical protein PF007_g25039 [Phytophthora fragariae]